MLDAPPLALLPPVEAVVPPVALPPVPADAPPVALEPPLDLPPATAELPPVTAEPPAEEAPPRERVPPVARVPPAALLPPVDDLDPPVLARVPPEPNDPPLADELAVVALDARVPPVAAPVCATLELPPVRTPIDEEPPVLEVAPPMLAFPGPVLASLLLLHPKPNAASSSARGANAVDRRQLDDRWLTEFSVARANNILYSLRASSPEKSTHARSAGAAHVERALPRGLLCFDLRITARKWAISLNGYAVLALMVSNRPTSTPAEG